ncbi:conserved hypothetical protein [Desulforamulus reducens MI-1]|uniref:Uncharacterized protein n=1 Tax=Desulforamulus reducens (strain ATCC BAA-1160 / DSM 100696 / MI-1) TaxID=349161 RepID=A4J8Q9_DESRM|nr:hypothetical protein [Desulforamulus reducens]ABO51462.1 conserved hypothetical protein [Desulforamulus reducens MI-1]
MKVAFFKGLALLVLGVLLGAAGTNVIIGKQVDHLTLANMTLRDQLTDTQTELLRIKESTQKKKKKTITNIETFIIMASREGLTDFDELSVRLEANEKVKTWLAPLMGQEVEGLDTLWIPGVVDNREIEANGNHYLLKSYLVVIDEKITVYLKATQIKGEAKQ